MVATVPTVRVSIAETVASLLQTYTRSPDGLATRDVGRLPVRTVSSTRCASVSTTDMVSACAFATYRRSPLHADAHGCLPTLTREVSAAARTSTIDTSLEPEFAT